MKKINLEEIINKYNPSGILHEYYHKDDIKYMLKLFGKQLLELAADNALEIEYVETGPLNESVYSTILNTIKQVE
jgi:hypothetical protein